MNETKFSIGLIPYFLSIKTLSFPPPSLSDFPPLSLTSLLSASRSLSLSDFPLLLGGLPRPPKLLLRPIQLPQRPSGLLLLLGHSPLRGHCSMTA